MNFFEEQARSRTRSRSMVFAFALSVLVLVAVINIVVLMALGSMNAELPPLARPDPLTVVLFTSTLVLAVIGFSSLYRIATLSSGGSAVAVELGATLVPADTIDPRLRRLRNVVEEMAIASGTPVPQIYVMEFEPGINAFASGYAPTDAAVTVTRGALDKLTRDELQGVIAHEFSHVLNGDMRLNIRLMGLVFGLLALGVIGRKVLEHGPRGRDSDKLAGAVFVIAFAVMAVGYVGLFCGRMIKAGVSRQREYLADASAVQFTRQSRGLAGALKKAAGVREGTRLASSSGEEVAHMLFGDGVGYAFLFATHPPLVARITRLEPGFKREQLGALADTWNHRDYMPEDLRELISAAVDPEPTRPAATPEMPGFAPEPRALAPAQIVAHVGRPDEQDYQAAHALLDALPANWRAAAHDPVRAVDVVFALLLQAQPVCRLRQVETIERDWGRNRADAVCDLEQSRQDLHRAQYLPLLGLALPALRQRPEADLRLLMTTADRLIHADGEVDVFEYALGKLMQIELAEVLQPGRRESGRMLRIDEAEAAIVSLLAVLARHGHAQAIDAQRAFIGGLSAILPRSSARFDPPQNWVLALDQALPQLDRLQPAGKSVLVEAMAIILSADGRISLVEAELFRAVCAALHVPVPPLLSGASE